MTTKHRSLRDRLSRHLDEGRHVVLLSEGDPLFYGSSMYLLDRFKEVYDTSVVPGVPAFAAATAALAQPLVRQTDVLTVLPGTLPEPELARRLADTDAAVVMKLGRTFPAVRSALEQAGRLEGAWYVERASQPEYATPKVTGGSKSDSSTGPGSDTRDDSSSGAGTGAETSGEAGNGEGGTPQNQNAQNSTQSGGAPNVNH